MSQITKLRSYVNSFELPKTPRREKWDTYNVYSPEMRATLGNYAVENNIR
jgi:hypothetical protein